VLGYHTGFIGEEWRSKRESTDAEEVVAMIAASVQAIEDRRRTATAPAPGAAAGDRRQPRRFRAGGAGRGN
jgi:hypothetical protein